MPPSLDTKPEKTYPEPYLLTSKAEKTVGTKVVVESVTLLFLLDIFIVFITFCLCEF